MQCNVGKAERIIRVVIGAGIVSLAVIGPRTPWAWLGLVPLFTGLIGWCPAYRLLKLSTYDDKQ
ncbi:MAG: DUF2892 domain-containing protein [Paludibacterium sp.]|uniref:YgaP family membrane protein n=1 Tax=Paludibacterium sp. TaxID=1917523 RepID=UPI0025E4BF08|nr:DUF2892 domain-containing protein [Paludibacterium sp.]MBV8045527.1 DUF2892 domain-containing protein [Paludibacterium sp.]MBV8647984.1 DUF2892 domain-containing protein [Paludibacterium sp.]